MATVQEARERFEAYDKADIEHLFRGAPAPDQSAFGYRHGWIIIGDQSFDRSTCFPELSDQPWMD